MAVSLKSRTCTLLVDNIPSSSAKNDVEAIFEDIGPLKKFILLEKKNTDLNTKIAYVTFAVRDDAELALSSPLEVGGCKLGIKLVQRKEKKEKAVEDDDDDNNDRNTNDDIKEKRNLKQKWKRKKPRLIIRNLSFKATESDLQKECSVFGELTEVTIPCNSDGKKRGFAFIQFKDTKSSIKAIKSLNLKKIKGRPIAIDFALPKDKYQQNQSKESAQTDNLIKVTSNSEKIEVPSSEEEESGSYDESHNEDDNDDDQDDKHTHESKSKLSDESNSEESDVESEGGKAIIDSGKKEDIVKDGDSRWFDMSSDDESRSSGEEDETEDANEDKDSEGLSDSEAEDIPFEKPTESVKRQYQPNDGRTLFVRNIPFMADEESFKECMEQFGSVRYALLCLDRETEHPKGTAFVRFNNIESAKKCLEMSDASTEGGLTLDGRRIYAEAAISREDIRAKSTSKNEKESKDKRNLYLAREGLIREGSLAANGVSKSDMATRMQLEVRKKQMLRNLHFFISRNRLIIHNLPLSIDNSQLRKLFLNAANTTKAVVTEARVMRNLKEVDSSGQSPSKGFGFVSFSEHEHALAAFRHLNNNPNIFSAKRRPIVEFSIENHKVLNSKRRKEEYSMKKRGNSYNENNNGLPNKKVPFNNLKKNSSNSNAKQPDDDVKEQYSGFISNKDIKSLPSHVGPKVRRKKKNNPKQTNAKNGNVNNRNKKVTKEPNYNSPETGKNSRKRKNPSKSEKQDLVDEKSFHNLVKKYKKTMVDGRNVTKSKWFDEGDTY